MVFASGVSGLARRMDMGNVGRGVGGCESPMVEVTGKASELAGKARRKGTPIRVSHQEGTEVPGVILAGDT